MKRGQYENCKGSFSYAMPGSDGRVACPYCAKRCRPLKSQMGNGQRQVPRHSENNQTRQP